MNAQQEILMLGTVTLAGCGAGLVLIHDSNPLLKGLNWMGIALVVGGMSAGLILASMAFPMLGPLANLGVLISFLCCYRADHYLVGAPSQPSQREKILLGLQGATAVLQWTGVWGAWQGVAVMSVLVALQLGITARLIHGSVIAKGRTAAVFTVGLMYLLAAANVMRAVAAACGLLTQSRYADALNLVTYNVFVSSAIGLAFAFFWRTTAKLSLDLEQMASTDPLTRVYNRRVFLQWCESEQSRSRRLLVPFSVLMVDFDHFKRINDTHGHHIGDQVLCAAVERIQDSIRGIDVLCRWGGEEFAVLLPNATAEATQMVAERVRRNILQTTVNEPRFAGEAFATLRLSASIGTATFADKGDDFATMLQRADEALYRAKRDGRNRVVQSVAPASVAAIGDSLPMGLEPALAAVQP